MQTVLKADASCQEVVIILLNWCLHGLLQLNARESSLQGGFCRLYCLHVSLFHDSLAAWRLQLFAVFAMVAKGHAVKSAKVDRKTEALQYVGLCDYGTSSLKPARAGLC